MENNINLQKIRSTAQNWSLEGDNYLLEWMKQIAENLENRSVATSTSLQQLGSNLTRTHIALDNVANSLNALQYSQFVESRCHNDDETAASPAHAPTENINANNEEAKSSDEIIKAFLQNNLNVLENCHERYQLDFEDDSDDEDASNSCIYQPKNPYNDRLLPHIYGSKLWKESAHVGLCDNESYSGDEQSDKYSESSHTPDDEHDELFESTTNLSEWASSTSITNDKPALAPHNAPPSRSQSFHSQDGALARAMSAANKVTSSEAPPNAAGSIADKRIDLFASLDDTPPCTSTSSTGTVSGSSSMSSPSLQKAIPSNTNNTRGIPVLPTVLPEPRRPPLVNENTRRTEATTTANESVKPTMATQPNPIKRRPVNLFDDDDYDSFMSEIVEKAQAKQADSKQSTISSEVEKPANIRGTSTEKENEPPKPKPSRVNLFESPDLSPTNEEAPFEDSFLTAKSSTSSRSTPATATRITAKSLFDDDDDDDDFLNVFQTKKTSAPKFVEKKLLFDDDDDEEKKNVKIPTNLSKDSTEKKLKDDDELKSEKITPKTFTSSLFDDDQDDDDLFGTQAAPQAAPRSQAESEEVKQQQEKLKSALFEHDSESGAGLFANSLNAGTDQSEKTSAKESADTAEPTRKAPESETVEGAKQSLTKTTEQIEETTKSPKKDEAPSPAKQQKSPAIPKAPNRQTYTNIFLDEPPDDDDFFQTLGNNQLSASKLTLDIEQDFYEPSLPQPPTAEQPQTVSDQNTSSYGGLNLFSEFPPDDDGGDYGKLTTATQQTKRVHGVFYDDLDETLDALRNTQAPHETQYSLFADEPPPDCSGAANTKGAERTSTRDELDHRVAQTEQSVPAETAKENSPPVGLAQRPQAISKLKMPKININVQALMPNASGKPNYKVPQLEKNEETTVERREEPPTTASPQVGQQNVLANVCKTRVRAPVKRRPSTRQGRQENYRKSLIAEEEQIKHFESMQENKNDVAVEKLKAVSVDNKTEESPAKHHTRKIEDEKQTLSTAPKSSENEVRKKVVQSFLDDEDEDDDDFLFAITQKAVDSKAVSANRTEPHSISSYLFDEPPDDSVATNEQVARVAVKKPEAQEKIQSSSLFDEPPEDALFTKPLYDEPKTFQGQSQRPAYEVQKPYNAATSSANFLYDDAPPEDLFFTSNIPEESKAAATPVNTTAEQPILEPSKPKATTSLFGDTDDDADDLFDNMETVRKKATTTDMPSTSAVLKRPTKTALSSSLFSSDDSDGDDDDDLFRKATKSPASAGNKPTKSLFGDDSNGSDNDELFSAIKTAKKPTTITKAGKEAKPSRGGGALFSDVDDEDDDDLFGAKSNVTVTKANTAQRASTTKSQPSATVTKISDNPLADLLDF